MKHVQERDDMLFVAARLARPNVIDNHVANFLWAMLLVAEIVSERSCGDFRYVLVFSDSEHLLLAESAKGDAFLNSDHWGLILMRYRRLYNALRSALGGRNADVGSGPDR